MGVNGSAEKFWRIVGIWGPTAARLESEDVSRLTKTQLRDWEPFNLSGGTLHDFPPNHLGRMVFHQLKNQQQPLTGLVL